MIFIDRMLKNTMQNWRTRIVFLVILAANGAMATDASTPSVADLITGNTLSVENRFGPTHIYFDPSGLLRQIGGEGLISEGTWRATEDSVCATSKPGPDGRVFPEFCLKILGRKMGESWSGDDPRNGKINFKLSSGNKTSLK